jgi:hypothetical protein
LPELAECLVENPSHLVKASKTAPMLMAARNSLKTSLQLRFRA